MFISEEAGNVSWQKLLCTTHVFSSEVVGKLTVSFCCLQWSFGVLLWELTTLAQQPYVEVDPFEMAGFLDEGYRLAQPLNCPDKL